MEAVLEPNPKEGPPGTILLRVRRVGPKLPRTPTSDGKLLPHTDAWRYWLDPSATMLLSAWTCLATSMIRARK